MNQETLYHKNNYLIRSWRINLDLFYIDTVGSKLEKLAKPFLIDHDIQLSTPCTCCHYLEHGWNTSYTMVYKFETAVRHWGSRTTLYINRRRHYDVRAVRPSFYVLQSGEGHS